MFLRAQTFDSPEEHRELAARLLARMTDEQALAQTFMLGWVGAGPSPLIMDWIRLRNIGGVKIFGWNTGDTIKLAETVGDLQQTARSGALRIPLLVATDQEGGWIRHVKGATSESPGNMAIGASGYPQDAYWSGYYIGRELAVLGVNMNFAPTVDLATNRDSALIGPRSFGGDPVHAGILGAAFAKGQAAAGIIATAKHYPGHGDTNLDSHGVLPQINASFETLWERELVPYRMLAREGIPAIMSGHLAFPRTPAASAPASLSPWFLKTILRDRIGFAGLIITDDLLMNGATISAGSLSQAAKQALLAGNDMIMLSKTPLLSDPVWTALASALRTEPAFRSRVRDAALRVLTIKLQRLRGAGAVPFTPDLKRAASYLPDPAGAAFFLDLAARSVTVVRGAKEVIPLKAEDAGRVLLAGQYEDFFRAGKKAYPNAQVYWHSASPENAGLRAAAQNADTIIFCLSGPSDLEPLRTLEALKKRVILFSILSPAHLAAAPWVDGAVAVYSYAPESFIAGFSVLLGRIPARGRLPMDASVFGLPGRPALP
ncbi:MAG: glycoside hydrolase family 3 protein [Treponema sp.]|nr:glycoside hydrolase family 3 protein [Treponema sp.]